MLTDQKRHLGASLVELVVAIGITGILAAVAIPSFITWINSTKIRTATESILSAVQNARAEAIKRNTTIRFVLTDNTSSWSYGCNISSTTCPSTIESRQSSNENTSSVSVASTQTGIAFSSLGRQAQTTNYDGSATSLPVSNVTINVSNPSAGQCYALGGDMRCLNILISTGGQVRMCDPALPASNPRGC